MILKTLYEGKRIQKTESVYGDAAVGDRCYGRAVRPVHEGDRARALRNDEQHIRTAAAQINGDEYCARILCQWRRG